MLVGIDVAKAELVVATRPRGEWWTATNDERAVHALVERLREMLERDRFAECFASGHIGVRRPVLRAVIQRIFPSASVSPAPRYRLFVPAAPNIETPTPITRRWAMRSASNAIAGTTPLRSGEPASGGWS